MNARSLSIALVLCSATIVGAQTTVRTGRSDDCDRRRNEDADACETRELTLPAVKSLAVDGRENGGVQVHGWERGEIRVVATVQAHAETDADAEDLMKRVTITTANGEIRATGPSRQARREWWSVSYEVWVPTHTDLQLAATNGGIAVDRVDARLNLETTNGSLHVTDVAGDVRGRTSNGSVVAELSGDSWRGAGLDLRTSNGAVRLYIPEAYSAVLETGTVNGGMDIDFPVTVQGSLGRRMTTKLGNGGATIRAMTTNGRVDIRRR